MARVQAGRASLAPRRRKLPRVMVATPASLTTDAVAALAGALTDLRDITLLGVVTVEEQLSLSQAASEAQALRTQLRREARRLGVQFLAQIIVSHNPEHDIVALVPAKGTDLVIVPWSDEVEASKRLANGLLDQCPSGLAILRGEMTQEKGNILVVLRSGFDSEQALRLALDLGRSQERGIRALRLPGDDKEDSQVSGTEGLEQVLEQLPQVEDLLLLADDPVSAVLEQAEDYDLVIVGAADLGSHQPGLDGFAESLLLHSRCPVIVARAPLPATPSPTMELPGIEAISILVDKWFAQNTFHADEFADLQRLLERKQGQGLSISLALPALNEEETIAKVIQTIRRALLEEVPLLDEIVLMDSNSTDRTREIAESLGIPVFVHQEILPQYGARPGKGEALWKSLYVTRGDIVLWIDTDIVNIHPRFVCGLIGPLLLRPDLKFIKGFYLRPMRVGNIIQAGGGGRVTELTARPLLNLFYPALSGLVQPLSGEYGGRRQALERVPFSSGYGVETGLLIDILERFGLDAIGQVDLIQRIHHNQPLAALSLMSFAIIQTLIRKIDRRYGLSLLQDVNRSMKLIRQEKGFLFLEVEEIAERERPPMISLPEYRQRFMQAPKGS